MYRHGGIPFRADGGLMRCRPPPQGAKRAASYIVVVLELAAASGLTGSDHGFGRWMVRFAPS